MIQIFGWTILHSLWQLTLIAAVYLVLKTLWKQASSLQQYYLALTAFISSFLVPIFTFNYLWQQTTVATIASTLTPVTNELISIPTTVGTKEEVVLQTSLTFADYLTMSLPYLVVFWGIGVLCFVIRFMINLFRINKLQSVENEMIKGEWLTKIRAFKQQLNVQKEVQVFLSKHVKEPITFGHFKPVILLPISLMTGFEPTAIETILLHELAHIKRHDYLINLGQSMVEIILFYHPCIWWLSKEIRAVREHCCDDLVLSMGDNRDAYVKTLTVLQWRKIGAVSNSLSMTASGDDGDFTRRIKRMFGVEEEGFSFRQLMGVFLILLVMAVGGVFFKDYLPQLITEKEESSITIISKKESELKVTEKTTKAELEQWVEMVKAQDIQFDFKGTLFNEKGQITELRGNYATSGGQTGDFFAINIPCTYSTFNLYNDQLGGPFFTHPCKKEPKEQRVLWINKELIDQGVEGLKEKFVNEGLFYGYSFNPETYFFNGSYFVDKDKTEYIEVEDVSKTPIKITIENGFVKSLEVMKKASKDLSSWTIKEEMSMKELFEGTEAFGKDSDTRVTFNEIDFDDNDQLTGKIRGTIRPNKSGVFHFFEIHDINKYNILFQANSDTILAPQYIPRGESVVSQAELSTLESSKIKINSQTTRKDLAKWANLITKHNIIFNYEKSVFDENDKLIGLNGKFNGNCCFNDAFFVSKLDKLEVHLEVKDNYIYQPTIITQTEDGYEELQDKFWSDAVQYAGDNAAFTDPYWIEGAMRNMKIISNGEDKSFEYQEYFIDDLESYKQWRDSTMSSSTKNNETSSSFIPQLEEEEKFQKYIDSVAQSSVGRRSSDLRVDYEIGLLQAKDEKERIMWRQKIAALDKMRQTMQERGFQNHAMLIPSDEKVIESIEEKNLLYHGKVPDAVFTAGTLTPKEDLPIFMKNAMATINIIGRKDQAKDSLQNYIQWDDQKFDFAIEDLTTRINETQLKTPKIQITKREWDRLRKEPFTFKINKNWYKINKIEEIVFVPFKADPVSVAIDKMGYYHAISGFNQRAKQLFETANVGDYIYYENIDIGKDFNLGIVVEIIESQPTKSTGFNFQEDVNFRDADMSSPEFIDASNSTSNNWRSLKESPLSILPNDNRPDNKIQLIGNVNSEVFFVNGIKWTENATGKLDPETIESINIVSGTKAQLLYGVDKAVLITTKKVKSENE